MDSLATLISTSMMVWFVYCLYSGYNHPDKYAPISDHFDLGYVRDNQTKTDVRVVISPTPKKIPKAKKSIKTKQEKRTDSRLISDCASALVSLGMSKSASKQDAKQFLSKNPHITSVENFLTEYFSQLN